ncbi:MAG: FAD-binding oxidoreductase [Terriglobia bacterium]|nr:FAD-binding oxidoreductase [Terriglobia bacterium]
MASTATAQLGRELAAIVGDAYVCDDPGALTGFAIDGVRPGMWVVPASAEEIAAILRLANERDASVTVAGGFTRQSIGKVPEQVNILLRTHRLTRVLHFDPGDLTIGMEAGCKLGEILVRVAEKGLLLPLDPPNAAQATIGGSLATSSFGPLKNGFGGAREYCIGVSFVTGDGRIAKAGGRVVKNVAGYDLMKLMIGSQGTLGVITSANFRLFPAPKQTATFIGEFEDCESAMEFCGAVRRSPLSPICMEVISPRALEYIGDSSEAWSVLTRAAGSDAVLERYRRELSANTNRELVGAEEKRFCNGVREFAEAVPRKHQNAMLMEVHLRSSAVCEVLGAAEQAATDHNFLFASVGRAGLASLIVALVPLSVDPPVVSQYASVVTAIRKSMPKDGSAVVVRCPREAKPYFSVWGETANDMEAMKAVKRALDPNGIMNRGRFLF